MIVPRVHGRAGMTRPDRRGDDLDAGLNDVQIASARASTARTISIHSVDEASAARDRRNARMTAQSCVGRVSIGVAMSPSHDGPIGVARTTYCCGDHKEALDEKDCLRRR